MKRQFLINNVPQSSMYQLMQNELNNKALNSICLINEEKSMLEVECSDTLFEEEIASIKQIINAISSSIELEETKEVKTYRRILILQGLDCANCAAKIERIAKRTLNHEMIVVDFATTRFVIETTDNDLIDNLIERVHDITVLVDPRIKVLNKENKNVVVINNRHKEEHVNKVLFIIGVIIMIISLVLHYIVFSRLSGFSDFNPDNLTNLRVRGNLILVILYAISFICLGGDVLLGAIHNMKNGRFFDEKFLMSIATILAFFVGSYTEAVSVMIFYKVGELLQEHAVNSSRKSISALMDIKPETARVIVNQVEIDVDPMEILPNDIILVKPGERIPLDGVIVEGSASIDTSALTGESKYSEVKAGDNIVSGSINVNGYLKIKTTKIYSESMVSKIIDTVNNASSNKAKTENFVSKFAKYYTPIICILALIIIVLNLFIFEKSDLLQEHIHNSVYPAMIFLVASCPCALVISVPLGFFGGIGGASKKGILVKGSNYLETLSKVGLVVFDKTGTLTKGKFSVTEITAVQNYTKEDIITYAAYCEVASIHPIAKSVVEYYKKENINYDRIEYLPKISNQGMQILLDGVYIAVGNNAFMKEIKVKVPQIKTTGLLLYVTKNNEYVGHILLEDEIREESYQTIKRLKQMGIRVAMVSGDSEAIAVNVAQKLSIDTVFANITAIDKVKKVRKLKKDLNGKKLIYVGDGVNDAPVLSSADVGIAMGSFGSDVAIGVADIVLMNDDLSKLPDSIKISQKTMRIVIENIVFALVIKVLVLSLAAFIPSIVKMWEAVFADVGVSLIAILNSLRAANLSKKERVSLKDFIEDVKKDFINKK